MKKLVIFALILSALACTFFGCGTEEDRFAGEWKFSKISKIELVSDLDESVIEALKEQYGAEDENGIAENALAAFAEDKTFELCYIRFEKDNTYTYEPVSEREATWKFYKLSENEGFLSFYAELDASNGNPDPLLYPTVIYHAENGTMSLTINYISFMVTIELTK